MNAVGQIVAEVLTEHRLQWAWGTDVDGCDCGTMPLILTEEAWEQHIAQVIEERLGAVERIEIARSIPDLDGKILRLPQSDPDGDWYVTPTHQRTITSIELIGEWTEVD